MKTNNNHNESNTANNMMANVMNYAVGLLQQGASVETMSKCGRIFYEIRKGNNYVCLCTPDFIKAAEIANAGDIDTTTPTPSESKSKSDSEAKPARRFAAVVADYIAGTWLYTIKPAAVKFGRKAAHIITRAALFAFRLVWFAAIFCASVGTMLATGYGLSFTPLQHTPILLRILLFAVCIFSTTAGIEGLLLYISKKIDNATNNRLFAMH